MKIREMISRCKFYLHDVEKDRYLEPEILLALNSAKDFMHDFIIQREPDRYMVETTFSTVADQQSYDIPTDMQTLDRIVVNATYWPIDIRERDNTFGRSVCWLMGSKFYLNPIPSESGTNNGKITHIKKLLDAYSEDDEWDVADGIAQMLALKAAIFLGATHGEPNAALQGIYDQQMEVHSRGARRAITRTGMKYSLLSLRARCRR